MTAHFYVRYDTSDYLAMSMLGPLRQGQIVGADRCLRAPRPAPWPPPPHDGRIHPCPADRGSARPDQTQEPKDAP